MASSSSSSAVGYGSRRPMIQTSGADPIYMDYNATTPIDPAVADAMLPYITTHFGNPSSSHVYGQRAKAAIEAARKQVAACIGAAGPQDITFTSGGTEAINWALLGVIATASAASGKPCHIVSTVIEHVAVLRTLDALEAQGHSVTLLPVDVHGQVTPEQVVAALQDDTALITIMHANNEMGTIQPIAAIAEAVRTARPAQHITFHCDTSQSIGKIPVNVETLGIDLATVAGHKIYSPKGIGALYVRKGCKAIVEHAHGGGQENGRRSGTENVIMSVGLGAGCELAARYVDTAVVETARLRKKLLQGFETACPASIRPVVNGHPEQRLPNTLSVAFPGLLAADILKATASVVAASAAAACHSGEVKISAVIAALGVPKAVGAGTLRFSLGRYTTDAEVDTVATAVGAAVTSLASGASVADAAAACRNSTANVVAAPPVPAAGGAAGGAGAGAGAGATAASAAAAPADSTTGSFPETAREYMSDTCKFVEEAVVVATLVGEEVPAAWRRKEGDDVLVTESTIFHPQGGGQPSDRGFVIWDASSSDKSRVAPRTSSSTVVFQVAHARVAPDGSGAVLHYGKLLHSVPAGVALDPDTTSMPEAPAGSATGTVQRIPKAAVVTQYVSPKLRMTHAALHSAGHLLDKAMRDCGQELDAGKGYHFADGPFVEYLGSVPAPARAKLIEDLQQTVNAAIAADIATVVSTCRKGDALLAAVPKGLVEHLPDDKDVRVVSVGGAGNECPCGGTHIQRTGQIKSLTITRIKVKKGKTKVSYTAEPSL